jgi:hypothetical protein
MFTATSFTTCCSDQRHPFNRPASPFGLWSFVVASPSRKTPSIGGARRLWSRAKPSTRRAATLASGDHGLDCGALRRPPVGTPRKMDLQRPESAQEILSSTLSRLIMAPFLTPRNGFRAVSEGAGREPRANSSKAFHCCSSTRRAAARSINHFTVPSLGRMSWAGNRRG